MKNIFAIFFLVSLLPLCVVAQTPVLGEVEMLYYPKQGLQPSNPQLTVVPIADWVNNFGTIGNYLGGYDTPNPYTSQAQIGRLTRPDSNSPFSNSIVPFNNSTSFGSFCVVAAPNPSSPDQFPRFLASNGFNNSIDIAIGAGYCTPDNGCSQTVNSISSDFKPQITNTDAKWLSAAAQGNRTFVGWHTSLPSSVAFSGMAVKLAYKDNNTNSMTSVDLMAAGGNVAYKGMDICTGPSRLNTSIVNLYGVWTEISVAINGVVSTALWGTAKAINLPTLNWSQNSFTLRQLGGFEHLSNTNNLLGQGGDAVGGYDYNTNRTASANADNTQVFDYASIACDNSNCTYRGRVYLAYPVKHPNSPSGYSSYGFIKFAFSDNDGGSYISNGTGQISQTSLYNCWAPSVKVDKCTGIISVTYFGKATSGGSTNTYVSYSKDGGNSFTTRQVSVTPFYLTPIYYGASSAEYSPNSGRGCDKIDVASDNGASYAMWADTHMSPSPSVNFNSNRYGVFGRALKFIEISGNANIATGNIYTLSDYIGYLGSGTQIAWTLTTYAGGAIYTGTGTSFSVPASANVSSGGYLAASLSGGGRDGAVIYLKFGTPTSSSARHALSARHDDFLPLNFDLAPNPAHGRSALMLSLQKPAAVRVEILDALGRRVFDRPALVLDAGTQEVVLDMPTATPGLYTVRLTTPQGVSTRKLAFE